MFKFPLNTVSRGPYDTPPIAPTSQERDPGVLAGYLDAKPMGKPNALGVILDVLAAAGGAQPTYGARRAQAQHEQQAMQKGLLAQQLEAAEWQRRQEYQRAHPSPFRFEANNGDQIEIGPDGHPRTLYKDPTPKVDMIPVKNPDGTTTLYPRVLGQAPAAAPITAPVGKLTPLTPGGAGLGRRTFP